MSLWDAIFKGPQGPVTVAEARMLRPNASAFADVARRNGLEIPTSYPKNVDEALAVLKVRDLMHEEKRRPKVQAYAISGLYQAGSWVTNSPQQFISYPSTPAGWDDWCDVNGIARFGGK